MSETMEATLGQQPIEDATPEDDDLTLWSWTSIIGVLEKKGLQFWQGEKAALAAIHQQATWRGMLDDEGDACEHLGADECQAVKWLRDAAFRKTPGERSDTDLGTAVHEWLKSYVLTGVRPEADEEMRPLCEALDRWLEAWQPEWHASEVVVYHPDLGYAGQLDGIFRLGGQQLIYDLKTTRKHADSRGKRKTPYPETALQLAGYRYAQFAATWRPRRYERWKRRYYTLSQAEREMALPVPEVDGGVCLHVTPEDAVAYPIRCDESVFRAAKFVIGAAKWHLQDAKDSIGDPLVPPEREEVA